MPYVFSTMSAGVNYIDYHVNEKGAHTVKSKVAIKGGSGVANKNLITPLGVPTHINDAQLEMLEKNITFQEHKKAGYITVRNEEADPEKVVSQDMESRDKSAPYTPEDFKEDDLAKPIDIDKSED